MFINLQEFEAPQMTQALGSGEAMDAPSFCLPVLQSLDYVFVGAPRVMPELTVAGGVLPDGTSVSGAGHDKASALTRLAGEAAEQLALRGPMPVAPVSAQQALTALGGDALNGGTIHATAWEDDAPLAVPATLLPQGPAKTAGFSEGMAAHVDGDKARLHGAMELVERDAVALWWAGVTQAASLEGAQTFAIARLGLRQGRETLLLDVTCDTGIPVIVAVSFDKSGGGFCFGAAAAGSAHAAACGALRELGAAEFGLALDQSRGTEAEGDRRWSQIIKRDVFEREMIGATVDLEHQFNSHGALPDRALPLHLANYGICFVDLGQVGTHFHAVKAISADLQLGRETRQCARFLAAPKRAKRSYQGPLY